MQIDRAKHGTELLAPVKTIEHAVVQHRPRWLSLVAGDGGSDHAVEPAGTCGFVLQEVTRADVVRALTG